MSASDSKGQTPSALPAVDTSEWAEVGFERHQKFYVRRDHINVRDAVPAPPGFVSVAVDGYGNEIPGKAFPVVWWAKADVVQYAGWLNDEPLPPEVAARYHVDGEVVDVTGVAGPYGPVVAQDTTMVGYFEDDDHSQVWLRRGTVRTFREEYAGVVTR